jgi:hypothetical protein
MSRVTHEEADALLRKAEEEYKKYGTNSVGDSSALRDIRRIGKLKKLLDTGVYIEWHGPGLVLIEDKFVVSLISNKWRVDGRNKWYMHKDDVQHFVDNYVLKDSQDA